jgi:hypothetical protein
MSLSADRLAGLRRFRRLTNYVAAARIYLRENVLPRWRTSSIDEAVSSESQADPAISVR